MGLIEVLYIGRMEKKMETTNLGLAFIGLMVYRV